MTNYTMNQYIKDAERTDAPCTLENVNLDSFGDEPADLYHQVVDVIIGADTADLTKRSVFYGTPNEKLEEKSKEYIHRSVELLNFYDENDVEVTELEYGILHAALGIVSEGGEILQALLNAKKDGKELDLVNLKEELGDVLWYSAKLARHLDTTFEAAAETNINKLKIRFKEKFSKDEAENRDLDKELEVLSSAQ